MCVSGKLLQSLARIRATQQRSAVKVQTKALKEERRKVLGLKLGLVFSTNR